MMGLVRWRPGYRVVPLVLLDVAAVYGSYAGALLLRFDGSVPADSWRVFWQVAPVIAAGYVAGNFIFGVYHTAWKYGGIRDLFYLAMAVASVTIIVFFVNFLDFAFPRRHLPVSVNLIGGGLIFLTMASTKLWPHLNTVQFTAITRNGGGKRVLIVGAGDSGQLVAREFLHNPHWGFRPVCFVDDDKKKMGVRIHGLPVAGDRYQIPRLVVRYRVEEVALAMPTISRKSFEEIMHLCRKAKVSVNIVPSAVEVLSGKVDRAVTVRFRD
jgi:FlaA1/EpsC-like NDP-sugar epimerase